jgi:phage tail-like protein
MLMPGPAFAHLTGRAMWGRCDHDGTRIEGQPGAVVLAPAAESAAEDLAPADYRAWRKAPGSAVVLACRPDRCEAARVLLAVPGRPPEVLTESGWLPLPVPAPVPLTPAGLDFAPLASPPAPAVPDGVAQDPWGRLWLLDRPGRSLRLLAPDFRVEAAVALPPDFDPLALGCAAFGLIVLDRKRPRLLIQHWGGEWHGYSVPRAAAGDALVALAADPALSRAAVLLKGRGRRHRLLVVEASGVAVWELPLVRNPLHLLMTSADTLLVGEPAHLPGDARPFFFREFRLTAAGPEAERGYAVRGFDGRALWLEPGPDGHRIRASTASGARTLYPREQALGGSGTVETYALDSGIFACVWHRLFLDLCLPPDCAVAVEAKTADDLPPLSIRRGARRPADLAGETLPPPADDPWPPLGSLSTHETEGWVRLGAADERPARADQPLADGVAERPSDDPLSAARRPLPGRPAGLATREFLITAPPGRYLWLRIRLAGTRRQGPAIFALRASFPRPSLLDYLPAYWRSDREGADATDRALALFEGWLTELDLRTDALPKLFDPRLVPADALPWLASFLALSFDGRVGEGVRRQLLLEAAELYRARGTLPGLIRLLGILAEAPVRIVEGFRLRRPTAAFLGDAAVGPGLELGGREGETVFNEAEPWELELLAEHGALLARRMHDPAPCPSQDPPDPLAAFPAGVPPGAAEPPAPLLAFYRRHAHRFTVIVPRVCDSALEAVLELAIEANKPAHTLHRLCWLDAGYRLGTASLVGISRLGPVERPAPAVLGSAVLSTFATLHRGRRDDRYPYFKPMPPWEASP